MKNQTIVVFDGVCNFCNGWVDFVLRHDKAGVFRFAPAQSTSGRAALAAVGLAAEAADTVVLIDGDHVWVKSEAALQIARRLPPPWRWLAAFRILPRPLRDVLYDMIARRRYRWFGRRDACKLPTPEHRARFLP